MNGFQKSSKKRRELALANRIFLVTDTSAGERVTEAASVSPTLTAALCYFKLKYSR
jgi:hypothetical protein